MTPKDTPTGLHSHHGDATHDLCEKVGAQWAWPLLSLDSCLLRAKTLMWSSNSGCVRTQEIKLAPAGASPGLYLDSR